MEQNFYDFNSGFTNLTSKTNALIPIIQSYQLNDLMTAIFAITSWRDNRSAQESCLSLNRSLVECSSFGNQLIETYENFIEFFHTIQPILKITRLDDLVTNDFGEIQACINGEFYPVITGTGHTGSVYSAMQFLEHISVLQNRHGQTETILNYLKDMVDTLQPLNVSRYDDIQIAFDMPTEEFFYAVKSYMNLKPTTILDMSTIQMFMGPNMPIEKIHFIQKNDEIFPLFNPSLILDYYTNLLEAAPAKIVKEHIHASLYHKIEAIHLSDLDSIESTLMYNAKVAIDEKISQLNDITFLYAQGKTILLLIDVYGMEKFQIQQYINKLKSLHSQNKLGFVDFNHAVGEKQYYGIKISSDQSFCIIPFNHYTNLNETYIQLGEQKDTITLTAIDLMFLIMISKDIDEISSFIKYHHTQEQAQFVSWGGLADIFSFWKQEERYLSKGAIEPDMVTVSFETSASFIFKLYLEWQKCFPFHITEMPMGFPEQWDISLDENGVYQFGRKGMNPQAGASFLLDNGGAIFFSYNLFNIMENEDAQSISSCHDLVRGLNERFVLDYKTELSGIALLNNTMIIIQCNSLNCVHENNSYVETLLMETKPHKLVLQYTIDTRKLMNDISNCKNREIESRYLLELLKPLWGEYQIPLQKIKDTIRNDSTKIKTVEIISKTLDYYMNPDYLPLRLTDSALLAARKTFAKIAAASGVKSGRYTKKEATTIVRQMQETLIYEFESQIRKFDRLLLHSILVHHYSSELLSGYINYSGYNLINNIDKSLQHKNKEKLINAREENKQMQVSILYLIETNLFLLTDRGEKSPNTTDIENLAAFSYWLGVLQSNSDICFHTISDTYFIVLDDYRVNVEFSEKYQSHLDDIKKRMYESGIYAVQGDDIDKEYFEKVNKGFLLDTDIDFRVLESALRQLMECGFPIEQVNFEEIKPNVIRVNKSDVIKDYSNFVIENISSQMIQKVYDFLTLSPEKLKSIAERQYNILPVWERRQRNERFDVKPLLSVGDSYIYSPITIKELHSRWTSGWLQFYPPYEIGLENALKALWDWKERYEQKFSTDVRNALREQHYTFAESDVDIHRLDRKGNHPKDLGDYDVIALDVANKKLLIIECKVLQPVGSIFEHSMQQKGFFKQNKYDEKFQKRIEYLKNNYRAFFSNIGYDLGNGEYTIAPYMVVNKVFDSYYKKINFPIVTFDELRELV